MKKARVIRLSETLLSNKIFDLNQFVKTLSDNDTIQFYSLLFRINYGGLSHDALLSFVEKLMDKYPKIKKGYPHCINISLLTFD